MTQRKKRKTPAKRKMSEMISEMAIGFLGVGDTVGERQNRLNAACTAWNMACGRCWFMPDFPFLLSAQKKARANTWAVNIDLPP